MTDNPRETAGLLAAVSVQADARIRALAERGIPRGSVLYGFVICPQCWLLRKDWGRVWVLATPPMQRCEICGWEITMGDER